MLKSIKKEFNKIFNAPTGEKDVTEMKRDNPQPASAAPEMAAELASALATVATQTEALNTSAEKLAKMQEQLDGMQAAFAAVEASKAALIAEAKAVRFAARKASVVAAVGTDKAESLLMATDALDDAAFQSVVGAITTNLSKEAASPMFKEVGVSASADTSKIVEEAEETAEAKLLRKKYSTK